MVFQCSVFIKELFSSLWSFSVKQETCKHRWAGGGWTLPLCSQVHAWSPITSTIRCSRICFHQKPAAVTLCCKNVEWVPVSGCHVRMINVCSDNNAGSGWWLSALYWLMVSPWVRRYFLTPHEFVYVRKVWTGDGSNRRTLPEQRLSFSLMLCCFT